MSFHVGQLVICIKQGRWHGGTGREIDPVYGTIYTVRDSVLFGLISAIRLVEIVNEPDETGEEVTYTADRFRPVDDTRLSIFRSLLEPKPGKRVKVGVE